MKPNVILRQFVTYFVMLSLALSTLMLTKIAVEAEVTVIPLWNATRNQTGSELCMSSVDDGVITLTGDNFQTCSVQLIMLIASNGTAAVVQIPPGISLYAERKGDILHCQKRYVSFTTNKYCFYVFRHHHVQLFWLGNPGDRNISISGIQTNSSICLDDDDERHVSRVSQTNQCHAEEFNDLISCDLSFDFTCSFNFPFNCNATLNRRDAEFHCYDDNIRSNYKALIAHYPTDIATLDLSQRIIIEINESSFTDLKSLKGLILNYNRLSYLSPYVLKDLKYLNFLSLRGNQLKYLPENIFSTLTELETLNLQDNNLITLAKDVFDGLQNLTTLNLEGNNLNVISEELFRDLRNLKTLVFGKNMISSLEETLFHENGKLFYLRMWYSGVASGWTGWTMSRGPGAKGGPRERERKKK